MHYSTVQAIVAASSEGESRGKLFTDLQNTIASVINKLFPYNAKQSTTEDRTKSDLKMLKRFMDVNNYSISSKERKDVTHP